MLPCTREFLSAGLAEDDLDNEFGASWYDTYIVEYG